MNAPFLYPLWYYILGVITVVTSLKLNKKKPTLNEIERIVRL